MAVTKKQDAFQTITPPDTLQKKVRKLSGRDAKFDPIAAAEMAVDRLSVNFTDWMDDEVKRLMEIWETSRESGFSSETTDVLYRAAHDMRGQASTLGFPNVGKIAGIFCDIIDALGDRPVPADFLEKYITAISAIARETSAREDNSVATTLAEELAKAGNEMIARYTQDAA